MPFPEGALLGRYELLEPIAASRLSEVYRARDTSIGRTVAVKVLAASLADDPNWLRRFRQEARAAGQIDHPNILSIHDVGVHEGRPYLVTEWLEGETLRQKLAVGEISWRKAVAYALQIAHGISAAHERAIVHRDLKPENVFVTRDGRIKVLDLGLAQAAPGPMIDSEDAEAPTLATATQPGVILGTVGYMSPEQVRGRPADPRSDIFSFGAILYEMVGGRRAFRAESAIETLVAILREDPAPLPSSPGTPAALGTIIERCLQKNPEERFQSARDLAYALEDLSKLPEEHIEPHARRTTTRLSTSSAVKKEERRSAGETADDSGFRLLYRDRELVLRPGENIVGRGRGATIQISSKSISRRHARIVVHGGEVMLEDLQSKNGTFLRGERIHGPAPVADGDSIRMGSAAMVLRVRRETATTETGRTSGNGQEQGREREPRPGRRGASSHSRH